ncbi:hypothetical protein VV867_09130 [Pseudomonas sp. JH-2]|uniref:hypothetical protein n=1 Tax=Pseudomonas sp. JH-2 TaxID=3114998 RepID=UPI002E27511D|nr:hypothetical protein [Pseudomonas sp. JH-2]
MNQFGTENMASRARAAGISPNTVRARVRSGMTVEEALGLRRKRKPATVTFDLALQHHINQRTVLNRMQKGMSLEEALTTPLNESNSRKVPREDLIAESWGCPADDVIRELRAEGKSIRAVAEIVGASVTWTIKRIHALEKSK